VLTADDVLTAVRVHADRVHDAVRRLGCGPEAAVEVVETSALDLIEAVARRPETVGDPIGWWFARARVLGRSAAGGGDDLDDLPVGGGLLSGDASQVRLAEALESRPERERAALLLRDSYDLPATAVGTVLGLDAQGAMEVVGAARLAFLPALLGGAAPSLSNHQADLAALARLGEGGQLAARDATTRRHVQSCARCADVLDAQERARRLLSGLTVVALSDADREQLLAVVEDRARGLLPTAEPEPDVEEWDDEPARRYSLSLIALGLVLATAAGIGIGILVSRGRAVSPAAGASGIPLVTPAPLLTVLVSAQPTVTASASLSPSPRVFVITPSPTPTPTATSTPSPTPTISAEPRALDLSPSSGSNDTEITVSGQGWTPGTSVTVKYLTQVGAQAGSTASGDVDERGRFTTTLTAHDPQGLPGAHKVLASDGTNTHQATFNATN
jgi:DNA-directed RNA polymerase specialized sigma24 family protein